MSGWCGVQMGCPLPEAVSLRHRVGPPGREPGGFTLDHCRAVLATATLQVLGPGVGGGKVSGREWKVERGGRL